MLTTIVAAVGQHVFLWWLWLRAQEIAAWAFALIPIYLAMQKCAQTILMGLGGGLILAAAFAIVWHLWT